MTEQRVRLLLGGVHLRPLVDRMEQRIRRGRPLAGSVTLSGLGTDQRAAVAALLGRPLGPGASISVRLEDVEEVVRGSGAAPDLATAMTQLRGQIPVASDEAAAAEERWERAFVVLDRFVREEHPELEWLPQQLRRTGRVRSSTRSATAAATVLKDLVRVLRELPANGETLAAFSGRVLHSAHALDSGPLRGLLDTTLAGLAERQPDPALDIWAQVGIAADPSASTVLVHALRFDRSSAAGRSLDDLVLLGRPVVLTLGQLVDRPRPLADEVFVCENPSVVAAAAERFGASCPPLVCVRGQPSAAAQQLIGLLSRAGSTIRYHGDFDWGGIRIANRLMRRSGLVPWRFRTEDLLAAQAAGAPLAGKRVEAIWDRGLAAAIEARGMRLEEEQVLETLLADLARPVHPTE